MQRRELGKNGPKVSAIGLGCWNFAGAYGATSETESHTTLTKALDCGIDFLDTANVYGNGLSEQVIGRFLKHNRGKFTIATKAGIYRDPATNIRSFNNQADHLRTALETSLRNLGVDCVDLYYIHRRDPSIPIEAVMETLVGFKKAGKIKGIGFSEIAPSSLRRAHAVHPVSAVQSEYSIWTRLPEMGMIQTCRELGVAFVPFSPLGRGMLTDRRLDPQSFPKGDFRSGNPRFMEPNFTHNVHRIAALRELAGDRGISTAALAIAWTLAKGDHLIPIPGTRSPDNLADWARASDISLTAADMATIEALLPIGFAHGARYSEEQQAGAELYC